MKKIVFTGGGSAGHVVPNMALMDELKEEFDLYYIGSNGIEKGLVSPLRIPYAEISCPKLVRGFSLSNLSIPVRFHRAVKEAQKQLSIIRPDLVFSKGGYVSLPVVFAAKRAGIPALTHESDLSLGLANRLMAGKCRYVLTSFPSLAEKLKNGRYTGSPMRKEIFAGNRAAARRKYGFSSDKPVLLVSGGGSGSAAINKELRRNLFPLLRKYDILHLCGKGNGVNSTAMGYVQIEFESDMGAAYACADGVVTRAGSNTVFEVLALKKPTLFVPLQNARSRGDQVKNAEYFESRELCRILYERDLTALPDAIDGLFADGALKKNLAACNVTSGNREIIKCIKETLER